MGYATLDAALGFPNNLPPSRALLAITDSLKSEANFLLHHFLINQLKADKAVVMVGLSQIFNHYFLIGRKLGINLQAHKQSGQFLFLDGLTHLSHYSDGTPYPPAKAPTAPSGTLDAKNGTLKAFYKLIQGLITKPGTLLVLDDISVLLYNGFEARQVSIFIQMLKTLVSSVDGTLITVMHADEEGSEDAEQDGFVRSVLYQSEVVFQVQALNSGLAKDVHGQLDILRGPKYTKALGVQPQSVHYKILDNGVHFFAKGVSQGVL